jgi:predicted cupin superfamily sugar epimerase
MSEAKQWIDDLHLQPHPEGGYYRQTYRCEEVVAREHLPDRFSGDRAFSTAIYFLLNGTDVSAFHRIHQDEVWHHYDGSSLTIHVIDPAGAYTTLLLGRNFRAGEQPQAVVKAGCLFGATVNDPRSYALVGCTVAPGFDFDDFTVPSREQLTIQYPQYRHLIERLTR